MKADKQSLWWLISILMLASAFYALISFKPNFNLNLFDTVLGIFAGLFTYYLGRFLQSRKNKQLVNIRNIFISSVIISPPAEEILFRFVIIVVLFSSSLFGILASIAVWAVIHLIYEIMSGTPFKYYRTISGFADSLVSGIVLSVIYVFSGFNLYAPLIAHVLHNFLIWISIAYPEKGVLAPRLKEKTESVLVFFSYKSLNIYSHIKYLRIKLSGFETSFLKRLYQWRACCSGLATQKAFHKFPQPSPIIISMIFLLLLMPSAFALQQLITQEVLI